ncbi:MerC domain-containing protein [Maricaulis sp.]|uniref:MerC domain-containing protein n=1 Tax=Maricaulis sp. TaxID=1486257 RepID=UPI002614DC05|nr:MerC domain-containing protein [Maricaulis sp.]
MRTQDAAGIGLSGLCLVHCLGLPVLISLSPSLMWMENELIHIGLASVALIVWLTVLPKWPTGQSGLVVKAIALAGLGLLFLGALWEVSETFEKVVTSIGAVTLAASHLLAWKGSHRTAAPHA